MSFETYLARDRRLVILNALAKVSDRMLNERILKRELERVAHHVSSDVVRNDIAFLAEIGAVIRHQPEGIVIAEITERGELHLGGGTILDGVERPGARPG